MRTPITLISNIIIIVAYPAWAVASLLYHNVYAYRGLQSDEWNRFVAGRSTCFVDDQVGEAVCGQEFKIGRVIDRVRFEPERRSCSLFDHRNAVPVLFGI